MVRRPTPRAQAPTRTPTILQHRPARGNAYRRRIPFTATAQYLRSPSPGPGAHAVTDAPAGLRGLTPRATLGWDMACN